MQWQNYIGELIIGVALIWFGHGFKRWADKLEDLWADFHEYVIDMEKRMTGAEKDIERLRDDCED